jgi:PEGA domain
VTLRRIFAALSFAFTLLLVALPSAAQTSADKDQARGHFERGTQLVRERLWDAALAEFLASRALFRTRGNTRNAAVCLRELQRYDEALDMLEALVQEFPDSTGDDRAAVDTEVTFLRQRVGTIEVRTSTEGGRVQIDERDRGVTPTGAPLRVSIGTHVVRVRKEGYVEIETRVEVAGGANIVVDATLRLVPSLDATLRIEPSPPASSVVLDGVPVGRGVWEGRVRSGRHRVDVEQDGFLTTTTTFLLASGQHQRVVVALDRDPNVSPSAPPSHTQFALSVDGGFAFGPPFGGDVAGCSAPCDVRLSLGGAARLHGGLEFPSGLGFSVDVGYLSLVDEVSGRAIDVAPTGGGSLSGIANDQLLVRGLLVGASGSARFGSDWPVTLRLGLGALLGSLDDEREAELPSRGVITPLSAQAPAAHFVYAAPEVRLGRRFGEHFELDAGVTAFVLLALPQPAWSATSNDLPLGTSSASYGTQKLTGTLAVAVSPSIGAKILF